MQWGSVGVGLYVACVSSVAWRDRLAMPKVEPALAVHLTLLQLSRLRVLRAARRRALVTLTARTPQQRRLLGGGLCVGSAQHGVRRFAGGSLSGEREARAAHLAEQQRGALGGGNRPLVAKALDGRL